MNNSKAQLLDCVRLFYIERMLGGDLSMFWLQGKVTVLRTEFTYFFR